MQVALIQTSQKSFWKGIWTLHVPNKVRHFIWRAYNNALPTMENLFRRQIVPNVLCNSCKDDLEDPLHIVWSCKEVKIIWSNLSWVNQKITSPPTDFSDLVSRFLQITDD